MARPDPERDRRLAEALRMNLRRRKDRSRGADDLIPPEIPDLKPSSEQP